MSTLTYAVAHEDVLPLGHTDTANAPTDHDGDALYRTFMRVSTWDANVRAGWMPVANGRKRMIEPAE